MNEVPDIVDKAEKYDADFYLSVERPLFHSGTLSRRSQALNKIYSEPALKIGPESAGKLGVNEGERVEFSTPAGKGEAPVSIEDSILDNRVYLSNNFAGKGVFSLMNFNIDIITKAPGIEGCEVTIKKL
jgi:predicted molibdopterin-dependent oxidoreductase YjgC